MYAVLDGEVEIKANDKVLETVTKDGVFGEMGLIDRAPRTASAVAKTNGRLATVTDKRFTVLVSQNPRFALELMQLLSERIRRNTVS
jgi:CRP-like cAMP-binding protein